MVKVSSAPMLVQRCIEWSDTDASGAWHNAAALRLVEAAEVALLDALGLLGRFYGRMPRARITIEFKRPLRFRDLVDVDLAVEAVGHTSVTYYAEIRRQQTPAAEVWMTTVLAGEDGRPELWPTEVKEAFLTAGQQPTEFLCKTSPGRRGPP